MKTYPSRLKKNRLVIECENTDEARRLHCYPYDIALTATENPLKFTALNSEGLAEDLQSYLTAPYGSENRDAN